MVLPVEGGQYRFAYKTELKACYIGVFHSYAAAESSFAVDLYIEALTPADDVPAEFVSLLGLPDLKRCEELSRVGVKVSDIVILDRLYICFNTVFQDRWSLK